MNMKRTQWFPIRREASAKFHQGIYQKMLFIFNNNSCCLIFLSLCKTIAMIGSTTLAKSLASSFLYTQILILSFCFAISTPAPPSHWLSFLLSFFSVFSSLRTLTHCFHSQMETKRTAILLFCFLLSFFLCLSLFCCRFRFRFSFMLTVVLPLFF